MDALQGSVLRREVLVDKAGTLATLQSAKTPQLCQTMTSKREEDLKAKLKRMAKEERALTEALQVSLIVHNNCFRLIKGPAKCQI